MCIHSINFFFRVSDKKKQQNKKHKTKDNRQTHKKKHTHILFAEYVLQKQNSVVGSQNKKKHITFTKLLKTKKHTKKQNYTKKKTKNQKNKSKTRLCYVF